MNKDQLFSKTHQSVEKAMMVLSAFERENREVGVSELSRRLGLHKSFVSRVLKIMVVYEFLQQNPNTRKYSLGPRVSRLCRSLNQSLKSDLVYIAKPYLDELRDNLGETVILEVPSGNTMVMAYVAEGLRMVRLAGSIGDRIPFHAAAGAKAFLAFCPKEEWKLFLGSKLPRFTSNTITNTKELYEHLEQVKRQGFAFDCEELDEGTRAVGSPVLNQEGRPVAAVVAAGPAQAITGKEDSHVVIEVKRTAEAISSQLYYRGENL